MDEGKTKTQLLTLAVSGIAVGALYFLHKRNPREDRGRRDKRYLLKGKTKKHVVFHVTGFGKFKGVDNNPTTVLMELLPIHLKDNPLQNFAEVASFTVLETSGVGSLFGLADRLQKKQSNELARE